MALSEGGRDALEAARKRLATAKSQATAAKQMLVHAQSMSDTADKEVKDAQTALNEAEKKYEVIDIDDEPETPTAEGSNKRRKVSVSPQANNNNNNILTLPSFGIRRSPDGRARGQSVGELDIIGTSTARNNTIPTYVAMPTSIAAASSSNTSTINLNNNASTSNGDQILFAVPGDPEVSGVYKQENGSLYAGAPVFTKQVGSNTFAIYRVPSNQKYWYIGH